MRLGLKITATVGLAVLSPFLAVAAPDALPKENFPEQPPLYPLDSKDSERPVAVPKEEARPPVKAPVQEALPPVFKEKEALPPAKYDPPPMLASTANYWNDIQVSKDGTTIQLVGQIVDGVANRLSAAVLDNPKVRTLVLSSDGGVLLEGAAMAHIVRKHRLNTHVEFVCASACTFPLLAGKIRSLAPGALIGFHQASNFFSPYALPNTPPSDEPGNRMMRAVYASANIKQDFIDRALATPPSDLWFPATSMLQENGVVTNLTKMGELPMAIGGWLSAADFFRELDSDPLWRAAKQGKPKHYQLAAAVGWAMGAKNTNKLQILQSARALLIRRLLSDSPAYSDAILREFADTELELRYAAGYQQSRDCDIFQILRFPVTEPRDDEQKKMQLAVLQKMIATPADLPLPDVATRAAAQAEMMAFWGRMIAEYSYSANTVGINFCREPTYYYEEMAKMPDAERVRILRSLMIMQSVSLWR